MYLFTCAHIRASLANFSPRATMPVKNARGPEASKSLEIRCQEAIQHPGISRLGGCGPEGHGIQKTGNNLLAGRSVQGCLLHSERRSKALRRQRIR